jgi:hypothetical protein
MVLNGVFPVNDPLVEARPGFAADQDGNFSALLLLLLTATGLQSDKLPNTAESSSAANVTAASASVEALTDSGAKAFDVYGLFTDVSTREKVCPLQGIQDETSAMLPSHKPFCAAVRPKLDSQLLGATISTTTPLSDDKSDLWTGILPEVSPRPENPPFEVGAQQERDGASPKLRTSREIPSATGSSTNMSTTILSAVDFGESLLPIGTTAKSKQVDVYEVAKLNTEGLFQKDLTEGFRIVDPTMSKRFRQPETGTQIPGFFDDFSYVRNASRNSVVTIAPDHTTALNVESEFEQQFQFRGNNEPPNTAPTEVTYDVTENSQAHTTREQDFVSQHGEQKLLHEGSKSRSEIPIETASHDIVISSFAVLREKTAPATARSHEVEWRPVIGQVAGEITGRMLLGNQEALLQLDPPELGKLRIDLYVEGDKLVAHILTESQESRELIENHLPELRQALGENRMELVDVRVDSLSCDGRGGNSQQGARHGTSDDRQRHHFNDRLPSDVADREPLEPSKPGCDAGRVSVWA